VEYSLTDDGKALLRVFLELAKWGEVHFSKENIKTIETSNFEIENVKCSRVCYRIQKKIY
jgi:DNA-binding HxlR family transcriptional regulator